MRGKYEYEQVTTSDGSYLLLGEKHKGGVNVEALRVFLGCRQCKATALLGIGDSDITVKGQTVKCPVLSVLNSGNKLLQDTSCN